MKVWWQIAFILATFGNGYSQFKDAYSSFRWGLGFGAGSGFTEEAGHGGINFETESKVIYQKLEIEAESNFTKEFENSDQSHSKDPLEYYFHYNFSIGYVFQNGPVFIFPGIGIGHMIGTYRTDYIRTASTCPVTFPIFCPDSEKKEVSYYHSFRISAPTIDPKLCIELMVNKQIGVALEARGFLNSTQSLGTIDLAIIGYTL